MITIKSGKLFVEKYNEEMGTNLTPKEIFCILAEKSFRGGRHLVNWTNSKFFVYLKEYKKFLEGNKEEPSFEDALNEFCDLVENFDCGLETSLNVYGGCSLPFGKKNEMNVTEFNYCDNIHFTLDERYCSFIGSFFQLCVGGFNTVLETKDAVWLMYESLNEYYDFIHNNDAVRDKQLLTWNGCYFYEKVMKKNEFIINQKFDGHGISSSINYLEFLDALSRYDGFNKKHLIFENFGNTNTTCGYISLDIEGIKGKFNIIDAILKNVDEDFDIGKYAEVFNKTNMLRMSMEYGEITSEMIDPLYDFRYNVKSKEIKNKSGIRFLNEYLKVIMTEKEIELAKNFGEFIQQTKKKGGKGISVKTEIEEIFSSKNVEKFGNAILSLCEKSSIDPSEGTPYEVISYFIENGKSNKLGEFIMFTKFNS